MRSAKFNLNNIQQCCLRDAVQMRSNIIYIVNKLNEKAQNPQQES